MTERSYRRSGNRGEQGYALIMVVFLTTMLLIATIAAAPSVRTERKREKEEEMVWRGKQYVRAIKLYYRKNGRFPTSLDDLSKPKTGTLRYLRQEYKDPMNKEDGSWRLIYVGPAGQLIGSLKPQTGPQLLGGSGQPGTPAAALGSQAAAQATNTSQSAFGTSQSSFGTSQSAFGPQSGGTSSFGTSTVAGGAAQGSAFGPGSNNSASNPSSFSGSDSSTIFGGNIIGVGSKIDRSSVLVYEKATNYHLFEFVWDPSKDVMSGGGAAGTQVGTPVPPGQGFGQGFGQPIQNQNPAGQQPANNNPNNPNNPNNSLPQIPPLSPNAPPQ
jgi:hypothetical protein